MDAATWLGGCKLDWPYLVGTAPLFSHSRAGRSPLAGSSVVSRLRVNDLELCRARIENLGQVFKKKRRARKLWLAISVNGEKLLPTIHNWKHFVDHRDSSWSNKYDKDARENEQYQREDQFHRSLGRLLFGDLTTTRSHRVALNT